MVVLKCRSKCVTKCLYADDLSYDISLYKTYPES